MTLTTFPGFDIINHLLHFSRSTFLMDTSVLETTIPLDRYINSCLMQTSKPNLSHKFGSHPKAVTYSHLGGLLRI